MVRVKAFLVFLVLLVVVAVGADFGAKYYAEQQVATALHQEQGLAVDPSVSITGFPFLTQLAAGRYTRVDVAAAGVDAPNLGPVTVSASLHDVALPASQVFSGNVGTFTVGRADTVVRVPQTTLGAQLKVPDLQVSPGSTGPGSAQLVGTVSLAGLLSQTVTVDVDLSVSGGNLVVRATDAALGAPGSNQTRLPSIVAPAVLAQISRTIPLEQQPFGITTTGVSVQGSDLVVDGTGQNMTVQPTRQ